MSRAVQHEATLRVAILFWGAGRDFAKLFPGLLGSGLRLLHGKACQASTAWPLF